jgi:lipoprotein-anchoring transpeptidase ErfK/SrfK
MSPVTGLKNTFWDFAWLKRIYSRVRRAGRSGVSVVIVVFVAFILIALFGFLLAQDVAGSDSIFKGVTIGGKAAGGMTRASAQSLVTRDITDPLSKPMRVYYGKHSYPLNLSGIDFTIDTKAMVDKAYEAGHGKNVFERMWYRLTGKPLDVSVSLITRYDPKKLKAFLAAIGNDLDYAPTSASVAMTPDHKPTVHDSKTGFHVNIDESQKRIAEAMQKPGRDVELVAEITKPKLTTADIGTIVVVSQSEHKVRQYNGETLVDTYPCAVGTPQYPTPNGYFTIVEKKYKPTWYPPNSDWAKGKKAIPPGPGNPLGPYWMGIGNGVGLHSTYDEGSLGYSASHGCVRMSEYNAMMLFKSVKEGTPVYIYP